MNKQSLKTYYSIAELLSFKLKSLPTAHKNVLEQAKRENLKNAKGVVAGWNMN